MHDIRGEYRICRNATKPGTTNTYQSHALALTFANDLRTVSRLCFFAIITAKRWKSLS